MDDTTGYYQGQQQQQPARPSPPPGQVPAQNRQIAKTDPNYLARKQLFAKLPDEWKKAICSETDQSKRLALFDMYNRKWRISEEQKQKQLAIQQMGAQYAQKMHPQNQPGYQPPPRPQVMPQQTQLQQQPQLQQQRPQHPQQMQQQQIAQQQQRPQHPQQLPQQPQLQQQMPQHPHQRQAKILRPVITGQNPQQQQGIKRNLSPTEVHQIQQVKRVKMEPLSPSGYGDGQSPQQMAMRTNSPQPNVVYIQQKMPDGQMRLVPATVIEQPPGTNGRPVYVQTNTPPPTGGMVNRMPQDMMRRQPLSYRSVAVADPGVRKLVSTNFSGGSPQPSPGSSSGSLDGPEASAGRTVPVQMVTRRVMTPHGVVEQRVGTPSPETVQQKPVQTPVTIGRIEPHLINRLGDNFLVRSSPSPNGNSNDGVPANMARGAVRAIQKFISDAPYNPMKEEPPRPPRAPTPPHVNRAFAQQQRKDPEYEKMILRLKKKFGEDVKRILVRQKIDFGQVTKGMENIHLILNFKFALPPEKWAGIEEAMEKTVDAYQICYPLYSELRRLEKKGPSSDEPESPRGLADRFPCDPWKACRDQIVHVPQNILDAAESGDY